MSDGTENKRPRGRPKLSPEEKAIRAEKNRLKKNEKERAARAAKKEAELAAKGIDPKEEFAERVKKQNAKNDAEGNNHGGARPGAGRPIGSKNIYSHDSVKKLEEMGFDPLEKLTDLYNEIVDTLNEVDKSTHKLVVKKGSMAHATLLGHLKSISDTLAKYSYRTVPERKEIDYGDKMPTMVNLTLKPKKEETTDDAE